tara:strand:+ start:446 stop:673 length:228 start_codon:yes stop_codon:yes gene_type:complete
MSGERLSVDTSVEIPKDTKLDSGPKKNNVKISNRVNINHLLSKVREEEKRQKKENLIFFGLISSVIIVTGIIASF